MLLVRNRKILQNSSWSSWSQDASVYGPVECIYEYVGEDKDQLPNQLYIHPNECIECGACEPECPVYVSECELTPCKSVEWRSSHT